jgi:hypothetical protein
VVWSSNAALFMSASSNLSRTLILVLIIYISSLFGSLLLPIPFGLITTSFDNHFKAAATDIWQYTQNLQCSKTLPLGDDFNGIVHLRCSVLDNTKKLVLTDADLGRSYLTQD